MIIYEKKYPKKAHLLTLMLLILIISLAILSVVIARADYMPAVWRVVLFVSNTLCLLTMLFTFWYRAKRYIDLRVKGMPAVVMTDSELEIYNVFGENTIIPWDEIADFERNRSKEWKTCRPVYKNEQKNKRRYFKRAYKDLIVMDYLDVSEKELLEELWKHL
jgi:hypothetical protein